MASFFVFLGGFWNRTFPFQLSLIGQADQRLAQLYSNDTLRPPAKIGGKVIEERNRKTICPRPQVCLRSAAHALTDTHTCTHTHAHTPKSLRASRAFHSSLTPSSLTELLRREQQSKRR